MPRIGCYPGSFDPPTIAHLAIARAARDVHRLDRVELVVSVVALGKSPASRPTLTDRLSVLAEVCSTETWLSVRATEHQLIADIAAGSDLVIVGADKWHQLHDPAFYGSDAARDAALVRLPPIAIAPRPPLEVPINLVLALDRAVGSVSSSLARTGRPDLMATAARAFDERTGAWSDPDRYDRWLTQMDSGDAPRDSPARDRGNCG